MTLRALAMTCITRTAFPLLAFVTGLAFAAPPTGDPLDPEKAFPVSAFPSPKGIDLGFTIAEGYYLYGDRFRVDVDPPGLPSGPLQVPKGEVKDDPFVGRAVILRRQAFLHLPFASAPAPGTYTLKVTAQGCAEDKVCYAPFTQAVRVTLPAR
jgi:thioredoxin:protein disulfide reductase